MTIPLGIKGIESTFCVNVGQEKKQKLYSVWVWILSFLAYTSYHLSRKPISVVKNVLHQNCSNFDPPSNTSDSTWCDWKPFDGDNSATLLGTLDSAFLFAYAFGMFGSGFVAERVDLRKFLAFGMGLSGIFCAMFGFGYIFEIHSFGYYVAAQALAGLVQATGWPGVVTAMGNWFGKSKRGVIFGIWNSHTSVGNILGTLIAAAFVSTTWGLSFIIPGIIICLMGVVVFLFLPSTPSVLELPSPNYVETAGKSPPPTRRQTDLLDSIESTDDESEALLSIERSPASFTEKEMESYPTHSGVEHKPITFIGALQIPGVVEFSLTLFFAKLVSYTFLYWLPNFILNSTSYTAEESANLSTMFDVGGIMGGIIAGLVSDFSGMSATTCAVMLVIAVPMLNVYLSFCTVSLTVNIILLLIIGLLVNGPYSLITTAVSAELGTHKSLMGNAKALATVTAIIDGTGSIGAAVGPLIAGPISNLSWNYVFYMLMLADVLALLLLTRLVIHEIKALRSRRRHYNLSPL